MKVRDVFEIERSRKEAPVIFARKSKASEITSYSCCFSQDAVPKDILDEDVVDYEYICEGDGNIKHDTLWIDLVDGQ